MTTILCVAEKPSIAKSITEILSSGNGFTSNAGRDKYCRNFSFQYRLNPNHSIDLPGIQPGWIDVVVTSVRGHLTSQDFDEKFKRWSSCPPSALFTAPIETCISKDATQIARNLSEQARHASMLMIWTDCDREGEHIGSEIVSVCRKAKRNMPVRRAKFSAIIATQIHRAMQHPIELDWNAVAAVECRIELDLRLGAAFTRLQSLRLQRHFQELSEQVISYGPCQFPTLGFVVEQYYKVMEFVPEPFWYIAVMKKRDNMNVDFKWSRNHLFNEQDVATIYKRCTDHPEATVTKVVTKQTRKFKPHPLTTVELQKAGGRLLRMAPKLVLDVAEKLYQRGILSYPRTETDQYDAAFDFQRHIDLQKGNPEWGSFANKLLSENGFEKPVNGQKNDKAHPPIHPTKGAIDLNGDEKRVYEFVTRRFLASCSKHALGEQTTVNLNIADEKFAANGVVVLERNFLDVFPYDSWGGPALPKFSEGERFLPTKIEKKEGETTRPKLLTEADLVGLMDRNGIGTDATIAEHIAKIIERKYVMLQPEGQIKYLVPSTLGMGLVEGHNRIELDGDKSLCKPLLRRETEEQMALICQGTRTKQDTIVESLNEYRNVFVKVEGDMPKLVSSLKRYINGEEGHDDDEQSGFEVNGSRPDDNDVGNGVIARPDHTHAGAPPLDIILLDDDDDDDDDDNDDDGDSNDRRLRTNFPAAARSSGSNGVLQTRSAPNVNDRILPQQQDLPAAQHCRCGTDARRFLVQKDGPNKGKAFWGCSRPQGDAERCGFFEWEEASSTLSSASRKPATTTTSTRMDNALVRRCECGLEAKRLTASKAGPNQGRAFWMCPNISSVAKCRFFEWEDESLGSNGQNETQTRPTSFGDRGSIAGQGCYNCGEEGHWAGQCGRQSARGTEMPPPRRRIPGKDGVAGEARERSEVSQAGACYLCGEAGHWSNACPTKGGSMHAGQASSATGGTARQRQGSCFRCGEGGHWSSECTNPSAGDSSTDRGARGRRKTQASGRKRRKT